MLAVASRKESTRWKWKTTKATEMPASRKGNKKKKEPDKREQKKANGKESPVVVRLYNTHTYTFMALPSAGRARRKISFQNFFFFFFFFLRLLLFLYESVERKL